VKSSRIFICSVHLILSSWIVITLDHEYAAFAEGFQPARLPIADAGASSQEQPASDQHGHSALAGHSPLADPAVLARRRAAAARKQKVIESKEMLAKTPALPH
jgi:hypothetical protein